MPDAGQDGFRRPLVKLSGEALGGGEHGIDAAALANFAADIAEAARGRALAIVVGGGNIFRGLAGAASGLDRVAADHVGMLATIINAVLLADAVRRAGQPAAVFSALPVAQVAPVYDVAAAKARLAAGDVVILAGGTGNPFFTTDTAAALRAAELGCDAILKATGVDGIYTADPKRDSTARRLDRITYDEALAGDLRVMDAAAFALARDNAIPIVIFSANAPRAIARTLSGEGRASLVTAPS